MFQRTVRSQGNAGGACVCGRKEGYPGTLYPGNLDSFSIDIGRNHWVIWRGTYHLRVQKVKKCTLNFPVSGSWREELCWSFSTAKPFATCPLWESLICTSLCYRLFCVENHDDIFSLDQSSMYFILCRQNTGLQLAGRYKIISGMTKNRDIHMHKDVFMGLNR